LLINETISTIPHWSYVIDFLMEPAMADRAYRNHYMIDHATSQSICKAIGERLSRDLTPESAEPSARIEELLAEMRRREDSHD
jgi:hypothetical protein